MSLTLGTLCFACLLFRSWADRACTILPGDRALSLYDSLSGKMVLKRSFVGVPEAVLALIVHCSGLPEDKPLKHSPRREL